jgi:drug/metabolite transporter (DMT)-like permease
LFQAIFLRGAFASVLLGLFAWHDGVLTFRSTNHDRIALNIRVVGEVFGAICLLHAIINMPIVNATAIVQVIPLAVTLGAALMFREYVPWRSYLAIMVGFMGVLLIIRPGGDGFNIHSLWAMGTVLFFTVRDLATRRLSPKTSSVFVAFMTSIAITVVSGTISMTMPWQHIELAEVTLLFGAAVFIFVGYLFSVMTMRVGEIGFVAPFRYSILLWASLLGFLLFGEIPDQLTTMGSVVIVVMGIYALSGKQRTAGQASSASEKVDPVSNRRQAGSQT